MKPIKMLGLAALAALLAMAFAGASSAMAEPTALCSNDGGTCTAVTHVHESTLSGSQAILKTNILTVKCDVLFLGDSAEVAEEGAPYIVQGTFTYTNCNNSCVATEENGPAEIKVLKEGHETSKITGEGLVHLECGFSLDCLYNGEGLVGTGKGPLLAATEKTNGEVTLTAQKVKEEGGSFFCPDTSELTITTTPLSATYIGSGSTDLCVEYVTANRGFYLKVNATTHVCETSDSPSRLGKFALVKGPSVPPGTMVCVRLLHQVGLYTTPSTGRVCGGDTGAAGWYELGTVK